MNTLKNHLCLLALLALSGICCGMPRSATSSAETDRDGTLGAGFRYSTYGPEWDPGPSYWGDVGTQMAARFPGAVPEAIWIVGRLQGEGTELSFPAPTEHPLIRVWEEDGNEEALALFDRIGLRVWLQAEPGNAPVDELIHLMLDRYEHHPCVVGVGVDVEWYRSIIKPEGQAVTDAEAEAWLRAARSHGDHYRLFLKHWEIEKMPPTVRDGIFFVDDSQIFPSLAAMVEEFAAWGRAFSPAPVGFQFGYPSDQPWWEKLADPPFDVGQRILAAVPNARGLYWVDFTVLQVFAPKKSIIAGPDPMVGVKIYEYEGSFDDLFEQWAALGINAAFVSETLAAQTAFRDLAAKHDVATFVIVPVFYDPETLKQEPNLYAITADGTRAEDDWVQFVCPSRREYRDRRVAEIADLVRRLRPTGVSLDFIRHFVYWESVHPETRAESLPNACFCPHCVARFGAEKNLAIPAALTETPALAAWILTHHETEWTVWKSRLITSMVAEIFAAVRSVDPSVAINVHALPWRRDDYGGAIRRVAGQDFAALSTIADYLSPMCYSFMLRRPPEWIHSVVRDLGTSATAKIVPSIQVKEHYRPDERFGADEFERCLREALKPPSRGVVFWSWDALAEEPDKRRLIREVFAER